MASRCGVLRFAQDDRAFCYSAGTGIVRSRTTGLSAFQWLSREQHLRSPFLGQIFPSWILRFDQDNFLDPQPAFQFLLPSNCPVNVVEAFVVDQAVAMVLASEALDFAALMLQGATVDAVGHTDVERAAAAGHDVDEIFVVFHGTPIWAVTGRTPWWVRGASSVNGVLRFAQDDRDLATIDVSSELFSFVVPWLGARRAARSCLRLVAYEGGAGKMCLPLRVARILRGGMGQGAWDLGRQTGLMAGKKSRFPSASSGQALDSGGMIRYRESSHSARNDRIFLWCRRRWL